MQVAKRIPGHAAPAPSDFVVPKPNAKDRFVTAARKEAEVKRPARRTALACPLVQYGFKNCVACGKTFETTNKNMRKKFCSKECRHKTWKAWYEAKYGVCYMAEYRRDRRMLRDLARKESKQK